MKVNTVKLQAGGYIAYQPTPMVPQQQAQPQPVEQQQQQPQEGEGYLDKSILEKMLGKGITTDVMQYSQQLQSAYEQYQNMSEFQRNSYKGRQLRQLLKGDLGQLNGLMRAKDAFDQSVNNAKSNDALDEIAVSGQGMVVRNNETGKIDSVSFGDFAKNKEKYTALTNAQLAEQREYNKDLINNSTVFSILNYGKGMSKVQEEVFKIVGTIGRTSSTVANGSFSNGDAQDVKELASAARAGMFKIKSGESMESNSKQIEAAQAAMWVALSANSKSVLRARAATMTDSPGDIDKYALRMMADLLSPHTTVSTSKTYDESMTRGGQAAKVAATKMANWGPYGMAFSMANDTIPLSQIGPQGVKIDGFGSAIPVEAYTSKDNTRTPLANAAKLNNITYLSKAFVANGDKVDPNLTVITGDAYVTELPYTVDENGNYKIDEAGSKQVAEYTEARKQMGNIDPATDAALRDKFGVNNFKTGKFVVAEAVSYDGSFFSSRDNKYYDEVSGGEKNAVGEIIDPKHNSVHHALWQQNDAHKHLIFIPAKKQATWNAMDGNNAKIPENLYNIQEGYNRGNDGTVGGGGTPYMQQSAQQLNMTSDSLNK